MDRPVSIKSSSTLKREVEDLVRLIFDVEKMREAMLEFELDLQKMPLGKLSKNQIRAAYSVLSDALAALDLSGTDNVKDAKIMEASNKYVCDLTCFSKRNCYFYRIFMDDLQFADDQGYKIVKFVLSSIETTNIYAE